MSSQPTPVDGAEPGSRSRGCGGLHRLRHRSRPGQADRREGQDLVVLEFSSGLTVTLPTARARESMRPPSSEAELMRVQYVLRADESPTEQPWSKRFRVIREKVTAGEAIGLAEVVRDGLRRQGNLAGRGTALSLTERELYLKARRLLAEEIGIARSLDPADADRWIADQVARTAF